MLKFRFKPNWAKFVLRVCQGLSLGVILLILIHAPGSIYDAENWDGVFILLFAAVAASGAIFTIIIAEAIIREV